MRRRLPRLANVVDPQGRVDVALYRMLSRAMEQLEVEQGFVGLREHMLPIFEDAILKSFPAENLIPREISAVLKLCELNRGMK